MFYQLIALFALAFVLLTGCARVPPAAVAPLEAPAQAQTKPLSPPAPPESAQPLKKAYLTFDDGPNSHFTGLFLDILRQYGVKATFVVVGSNIERNPEVFKRILAEGHSVVNHTYSHDYKRIYASPEAFLADLERGSRSMAAFTGTEVKLFRAPGGPSSLSKNYLALPRQKGYRSLGWNVSSADTDPQGVSPQQIIDNVKNGVGQVEKANNAPVILMHDGAEVNLTAGKPGAPANKYIRSRESDVAALPVIIEFLQEKGYTLAGFDEDSPLP